MKKIIVLVCLFAFAANAYGQVREDSLFREGQRRFLSSDYELADSLFSRYLQDYPEGRRVPDALFHRAIIEYKLGNYRSALDKIEDFILRYPGYDPRESVLFWRGCILYQLEEYGRAAADLGVFLLSAEDERYKQKALLFKGVSEIKLGSYEKGAEYLEQAVFSQTNPEEKAFAAINLFSVWSKQGDYGAITRMVEDELAGFDFGSLSSYRDLYYAEALWNTGNIADAEELYLKMISGELPGDTAVFPFKRLFSLYQREGREGDLQILVEQAEVRLSDKPAVLSEFRSVVGVTSFQNGKFDLAESYLTRAWRMRDKAPVKDVVPVYLAELERRRQDILSAAEILETYFTEGGKETILSLAKLGAIYIQNNRWDAASRQFGKLIEKFPEAEQFGEYAYFYAFSLYKLGSSADALSALSSVLESGKGGDYTDKLHRLSSIVRIDTNQLDGAISSLRQYLPRNENDYSAWYDLFRIYYRLEKYDTVVSEVERFYETHPDFEDLEPEMNVLFRYLHGLSVIPGKEYGRAAGILGSIREDASEYVPEIEAYVLFYTGWALYRNVEYARSLEVYRTFLQKYPDHPLRYRAVYTAGWCAYTEELYEDASDLFQTFFDETIDPNLRMKGILMFGKSAGHLGNFEDAEFSYQYIAENFPDSELADDALFEYAETLRMEEKIDRSIDAYRELFLAFPNSSLAEEAMYRRGELLYRQGRYIEARNAFYEYRNSFPEGELMDAALYWGGMAFKYSDEPFGAVLLWERLIASYPESSFRPDSMAETAEIYLSSGNLDEALDLYNKLINRYPVEAKSVQAEIQREKIRNMIQGMSGREAELSALIARDGVDTENGRDAVLELSRIYIYRGMSREEELNRAKLMLEMIVEKRTEDPEAAARAKYLLGEYYFRIRNMEAAANAFIEAATMYPRDRDFMASAMYKAAEITIRIGSTREAASLVERMEKNFPGSQWSLEARKLLEERR